MKLAMIVASRGRLSGGYQTYLENVVPLLRVHPEIESLRIFMPSVPATALGPSLGGVESLSDPSGRDPRLRSAIAEADVAFIPTARWLDVGPRPVVTMVQNMLPMVPPFPQDGVMDRAINLYRRRMTATAVRRAARVIAMSDFVRDHLVTRMSVPAEKVGVVPPGTSASDATEGIRPDHLDESVGRFLFTAGSVHPFRGLEDVLHAFARLDASGLHLVIAGQPDEGAPRSNYRRDLGRLAVKLGISERVIWTGQLPRTSLAWCYTNCTAFVVTSRVEAGPSIVLESLAHGAICASSDAPPMPEFYGDSAAYYRTGDPADLARVLSRLLALSPEERDKISAAAKVRAGSFPWSTTVDGTVAELSAALRVSQ